MTPKTKGATKSDSYICLSEDLKSGGTGIEFTVLKDDEILPAFAIRFRDVVYAYINRCSHMELKLNFVNDDFFDLDKKNLICATHGAVYDPTTGACLGGPCNGLGLVPITVCELEGKVALSDNNGITLFYEKQ